MKTIHFRFLLAKIDASWKSPQAPSAFSHSSVFYFLDFTKNQKSCYYKNQKEASSLICPKKSCRIALYKSNTILTRNILITGHVQSCSIEFFEFLIYKKMLRPEFRNFKKPGAPIQNCFRYDVTKPKQGLGEDTSARISRPF